MGVEQLTRAVDAAIAARNGSQHNLTRATELVRLWWGRYGDEEDPPNPAAMPEEQAQKLQTLLAGILVGGGYLPGQAPSAEAAANSSTAVIDMSRLSELPQAAECFNVAEPFRRALRPVDLKRDHAQPDICR